MLDTSETLSIVARRLLKILKKTETQAKIVGDRRTIHSLGGDETVTQHCRVLDTDVFDILTGTDFLRRNPQGNCAVSPAPLFFALRLWQWAFLRTFGAVRTRRVWAALRIQD